MAQGYLTVDSMADCEVRTFRKQINDYTEYFLALSKPKEKPQAEYKPAHSTLRPHLFTYKGRKFALSMTMDFTIINDKTVPIESITIICKHEGQDLVRELIDEAVLSQMEQT